MSRYTNEQKLSLEQRCKDILDEFYHDDDYSRSFNAFFDDMANTRRSSNTIYAYVCELQRYINYLVEKNDDLTLIYDVTIDYIGTQTVQDISDYLSFLRESNVNEAGRARSLAALRSLFQFYVDRNVISINTPKLVKTPQVKKGGKNRLQQDQLAELINGTKTGDVLSGKKKKFAEITRYRDTAIILLLSGTGIRVSELVGLDIDNLDLANNQITVTRKGGDDADVPIGNAIKAAIVDYLVFERDGNYEKLRNDEKALLRKIYTDASKSGQLALFLSSRGERGRLTVRSVERLVKKYSKDTNPANAVTPHGLRRTFGTALYNDSGDIYLVADALGHSSVQTTKDHYADIDKKRQAVVQDFSDKLLDT